MWRQALFFSAASIAGAFSGLLAFAIANMDGIAGLEGWRWIFIIEGLCTVTIAFASYFFLWDYPETANFLTAEERQFVTHRIKFQAHNVDEAGRMIPQDDQFSWLYVRAAIFDWQVWANIIVFWGIQCPLYGIALFLPTIIRRGMHVSPSTAQLLTVPIYLTAAVFSVFIAFLSDRKGQRSPFILLCFAFMAIGFIMCISSSKSGIVYAGVSAPPPPKSSPPPPPQPRKKLTNASLSPGLHRRLRHLPRLPRQRHLAQQQPRRHLQARLWHGHPNRHRRARRRYAPTTPPPAPISLSSSKLTHPTAMASNFYRARDEPRYILGHALELGFILAGMMAAACLMLSYRVINRRRAQRVTEGAHFDYSPRQLSELGDKAVTFRYIL